MVEAKYIDDFEIFRTMCKRLKEERENRGLSLEKVGELIGKSKGTYSKWEKGQVERITTEKISILADFYRISPTYLMGFDVPRLLDTDEQAGLKKQVRDLIQTMNSEKLKKLIRFINEYLK